jgi:hypothetical protein
MKPSRYAERARYAGRACDGRWKAATLVSGAAPRRTSGAGTGSALSESGGEANSGKFLNQPAHIFTISLFPCTCPVMVADAFAYAKQQVIGMDSS